MDYGSIIATLFILSIVVGWVVTILKGIVHFLAFVRCIGKRSVKKMIALLGVLC